MSNKPQITKHYMKSGKLWTLCGRRRTPTLKSVQIKENVTCKICLQAIAIWQEYRER